MSYYANEWKSWERMLSQLEPKKQRKDVREEEMSRKTKRTRDKQTPKKQRQKVQVLKNKNRDKTQNNERILAHTKDWINKSTGKQDMLNMLGKTQVNTKSKYE